MRRNQPEPLDEITPRVKYFEVAETKQAFDPTKQLFEKRTASKSELEVVTANHAAARGIVCSAQSTL